MKAFKILFIILLLPIGIYAQESSKQFFVFLNTNPNKEVLDTSVVNDLQKRHLANIDHLYEEGKIVAAGPFYDGGGLFIFKESSLKNVNVLLQSDPAISANRFILEVYPMEFVSGSIGQYIEPIEMVSYSFIRIQKAKNNVVRKRLEGLETKYANKVLSSAIFTNHTGGFLVLDADHQSVKKQFDKMEKHNVPSLILKQLYIAKGTFKREPKK